MGCPSPRDRAPRRAPHREGSKIRPSRPLTSPDCSSPFPPPRGARPGACGCRRGARLWRAECGRGAQSAPTDRHGGATIRAAGSRPAADRRHPARLGRRGPARRRGRRAADLRRPARYRGHGLAMMANYETHKGQGSFVRLWGHPRARDPGPCAARWRGGMGHHPRSAHGAGDRNAPRSASPRSPCATPGTSRRSCRDGGQARLHQHGHDLRVEQRRGAGAAEACSAPT